MIEIFEKAKKEPKHKDHIKQMVEDAATYRSYYTGKGLEKLLTSYRINETENQKNQRKRINISLSKSLISQIENIFNQLKLMDKPSMNVIHEKEDEIESWIYSNNIDSTAFDLARTYNLIDANAYVVASVVNGEVRFNIYPSSMIHDYELNISGIEWVMFKINHNNKEKYVLYHKNGIIDDGIETPTEMMFAFPLGIQRDGAKDFKTYKSFLDPASDALKALLWQGSELDTIKATKGIIKEFYYEDRCNYSATTEDDLVLCESGILSNGTNCPKCQGTGLKIHRSSQDIISYPMPMEGSGAIGLDKMHHIVQVDTSFMEFLKNDINDIRHEIIRTVFNASTLTKDDINATATGEMIDLQGIYATLAKLSHGVSNLFIWMVEIYCSVNGIVGAEILHGYTLSLKLESVETLADKRKKLIDANAPQSLIKAVDLAILQKQHADSPSTIDKFSIWELYRPFTDKGPNEIQFILSGLGRFNYYKVLYMFFSTIKINIELKHDAAFYMAKHEDRLMMIKNEVDIIINEMKQETEIVNPFAVDTI